MIDPFAMKHFSKVDPRRLMFTAMARLHDRRARGRFAHYALPLTDEGELTGAATDPIEDTDVDKRQMAVLARHFLAVQHTMPGGSVEIGAYRGVTTLKMSRLAPDQSVFAVDPFMGYGGSDEDFARFRARTGAVENVTHIRKPSGVALAELVQQSFSFVFIDAVHDYVNVRFDGLSWFGRLRRGGLIAFHDTDDVAFPGTRRAVYEIAGRADAELVAHVPGLVILRKLAA